MVFSKKKSSRATNVGSLTYGSVSQNPDQEYSDSLYRILQSGLDLSAPEQQAAAAGATGIASGSPKKTGSKHSSGVNTLPLLRSAKKEKKRKALRQSSEVARSPPSPHNIPQYDGAAAATASPPQSYLLAFRGASLDPSQRPFSEYVPSNYESPDGSGTVPPEEYRHSVHVDRLQGFKSASSLKARKKSSSGKKSLLLTFR